MIGLSHYNIYIYKKKDLKIKMVSQFSTICHNAMGIKIHNDLVHPNSNLGWTTISR